MASSQRCLAGSLFGWMAPVLSVDVLPAVDREPNSACLALVRALVSAIAFRTLSFSFGIVKDVGSWYRTSSLPAGLVPMNRKLGIEVPVNPGRNLTVSSWLLLSSISRSMSWIKIVCWVSSSNIGSVNFCGLCWRVGCPFCLWWLLRLVTDSENDKSTVNDLHLCAINRSTVIYTYLCVNDQVSLPKVGLLRVRFLRSAFFRDIEFSRQVVAPFTHRLSIMRPSIYWSNQKKVIRAKKRK